MRTSGLIEVILYVADMDRQVAFYRDTLGLPVTYPPNKTRYDGEFWVTLDAGGCVLALHGGGQGRLGADAPKIVFGVDEIHAARAALLADGVAVGEPRAAAPGIWVCDGHDPEGNPFSIEARDR